MCWLVCLSSALFRFPHNEGEWFQFGLDVCIFSACEAVVMINVHLMLLVKHFLLHSEDHNLFLQTLLIMDGSFQHGMMIGLCCMCLIEFHPVKLSADATRGFPCEHSSGRASR